MRVELVAARAGSCGMLFAGLDRLADRRSRPRGCRGVVGSVPAASVSRLADMGEVGADACRRPACRGRCGTSRRASRGRPRCPRPRSPVAGGSARRELAGRASARTPPRLGDDQQAHMGVLQAAEFGALAAIDAGPVGREARMSFSRPGIRSCLPARFGTQNEWITSDEFSLTLHRLARPGCGSRSRVVKVRLGSGILVAHLPPPLMAGDADRDRLLARRRRGFGRRS